MQQQGHHSNWEMGGAGKRELRMEELEAH